VDVHPPTTRRRSIQFSIGFLLILTAVCGGLTCIGQLVTQRIEGQGTSADVANQAFGSTACILRLPTNARNVDFAAWFQGGIASFDVSEADFLDWAKSYPWELSEIPLEWQGACILGAS
jgi:hypothetical protein